VSRVLRTSWLLKLTCAALTLGLLSFGACSGGGGKGGAGIGGSGYKADGTVTEFGSVFVNGVEFDTSAAVFEIEGASGSQASLILGMRVQVEATLDASGTKGTATRVTFEDELEGPIPAGGAITEDADQENKDFSILGVAVRVNVDDTTFSGLTYQSLALGDSLQISGFYDAAGLLRATAVVKKGAFTPNASIVEARGTVASLGANTIGLRVGATTLTVDTTQADLSQVPGGLAVGQVVEAKGTIASDAATSILATAVKLSTAFTDGDTLELEGSVTRFVSQSDFDVEGTKVNASGATLDPTNFTLALGERVEVEGKLSSGVLQASIVRSRGGERRAHATASNVNVSAGTFDLTVAGQTVRVKVTTTTKLKDTTAPQPPLTLATLANLNGKFVKVRGLEDASGAIVATRVFAGNLGTVELQGPITAQVIGTSVTVLGVVFPVDGTTKFSDSANADFPGGQADFANNVTLGSTPIRVRDKQVGPGGGSNAFGVADQVEVQTP
tara:strand:+ start:1234 stop:2736 length:1503 start_codon:yes stop_codon:yes gene_type:complete